MQDENSAGASYLASLKKSNPAATGAAAAPAQEEEKLPLPAAGAGSVVRSPAARLVGKEKRRSPRYRCQGSAHLRELNSGVASWATFTDISLLGVYVEAMSTFPLGARLAITLEASGFRVENHGEVRVVYPGLAMGIGFTAMSEPDRERLRQLLKSLSPPSVLLTPRVPDLPVVLDASSLPPITDPAAALRALANFFDQRHMLSREEFMGILKKSQG
jgi:hypothetical protein